MSELAILQVTDIPAGVYVYVYKDRSQGFMEIAYGLGENKFKSPKIDMAHYEDLKARLLSLGLEMEFEGKAISMFIRYR